MMTRREPRRISFVTGILWAAGLAVLSGLVGPARSSGSGSLEERCRREVVELHRFFQDWFNGTLEPTDESFARLAEVLDEDFILIPPNGRMMERVPLVEGLRQRHSAWKESGSGRIWIEKFRLHRVSGDVVVVTYEEWQDVGGEVEGRLSTAFLGQREGAPNALVWLHLHEVALPRA